MNHVVDYFGPKECLSKQKRYIHYKMEKTHKLATRQYVGLVCDLNSRMAQMSDSDSSSSSEAHNFRDEDEEASIPYDSDSANNDEISNSSIDNEETIETTVSEMDLLLIN